MAFRRFGRKYARKGKKGSVVRKAVRRSKATSFSKKVINVIRSQNETKHAFHSQGLISFNSAINSSGDALQILPNMSNGTGDSQRIGDQIRMTSCVLKGYLQMNLVSDANTYSNRKIAVRMMILKPKRYGTLSDTQNGYTQWQSVLLKKGASAIGFTGLIPDLWAPLNTDVVTKLYDKVFYMHQSPIISLSATGLVSPDISNTTRVFSIRIPGRNRLCKYDLNNDNGLLPVNENWVLCLGYVHMDGGAADVVPTQVSLAFDTNLTYEDA